MEIDIGIALCRWSLRHLRSHQFKFDHLHKRFRHVSVVRLFLPKAVRVFVMHIPLLGGSTAQNTTGNKSERTTFDEMIMNAERTICGKMTSKLFYVVVLVLVFHHAFTNSLYLCHFFHSDRTLLFSLFIFLYGLTV